MTSNTEPKGNISTSEPKELPPSGSPVSKNPNKFSFPSILLLLFFSAVCSFALYATAMTQGKALPEFISSILVIVSPAIGRWFYLEKLKGAMGKDEEDKYTTPEAQATADWMADSLFAGLSYVMLAAYLFTLGLSALRGDALVIYLGESAERAGWASLVLSFVMLLLIPLVLPQIARSTKISDYAIRHQEEGKNKGRHFWGVIPRKFKYKDTATRVKWLRFGLAVAGFATVFGDYPFLDIFKF